MSRSQFQAADRRASAFAAEVDRVRDSGTLGATGRLRDLFDFLAARGNAAEPVSQAEISGAVFGQTESIADDATVRVYIHRLRKRLDDFYVEAGEDAPRLTIPPGIYALRLLQDAAHPDPAPSGLGPRRWRAALPTALMVALGVLLVAGAFLLGRSNRVGAQLPEPNAMWQPFLASDRPIVVVLGDYYIFGEIDPVRPETGRLIRDFAINSPTDLARAQERDVGRYGNAEDVGLNYLPFSSAYALRALMPILAQHEQPVEVMPASAVDSDTLRNFNVVYVGLISGMGLLEDINFMQSTFAVGPSYDELIDLKTNRDYVSEEARQLSSGQYYRDYAYVSQFREPGGALVAVVAGARDTALRGIAPVIAGPALPEPVAKLAADSGPPGFEVLFEVIGHQGSDLKDRLIDARPRTVPATR
ncbi:helix-turn-helix domain-containing protein [Altericroceibacterium xinjiangense]|uniref:helix-turn-helix domain-containing protein n=1 Tax=Altericroceibacterium xinjiangense TaxID=762261 RepID=UPI000F7E0372|nr:helix-turn-helix domain-containing protein [Altericroceibacterium xinjiangense]